MAITLKQRQDVKTKDLDRFKKQLLEQKEQINKNLEEAASELRSLSSNGSLADEIDQASVSADSLVDSAISMQQSAELTNINKALSKIENKTFGICEMCGEPIGIERLKVKPYAKFCIDCREIYEKEKKER